MGENGRRGANVSTFFLFAKSYLSPYLFSLSLSISSFFLLFFFSFNARRPCLLLRDEQEPARHGAKLPATSSSNSKAPAEKRSCFSAAEALSFDLLLRHRRRRRRPKQRARRHRQCCRSRDRRRRARGAQGPPCLSVRRGRRRGRARLRGQGQRERRRGALQGTAGAFFFLLRRFFSLLFFFFLSFSQPRTHTLPIEAIKNDQSINHRRTTERRSWTWRPGSRSARAAEASRSCHRRRATAEKLKLSLLLRLLRSREYTPSSTPSRGSSTWATRATPCVPSGPRGRPSEEREQARSGLSSSRRAGGRWWGARSCPLSPTPGCLILIRHPRLLRGTPAPRRRCGPGAVAASPPSLAPRNFRLLLRRRRLFHRPRTPKTPPSSSSPPPPPAGG